MVHAVAVKAPRFEVDRRSEALHAEADEGVGRGPGAPPRRIRSL
jgi:hypothetical protein